MGAGQHPFGFAGPLEVVRYAVTPPVRFNLQNLPPRVERVPDLVNSDAFWSGPNFHVRYRLAEGVWVPILSLLMLGPCNAPEEKRRLIIQTAKAFGRGSTEHVAAYYRIGVQIGTVSTTGEVAISVHPGQALRTQFFPDAATWQGVGYAVSASAAEVGPPT